MFHIVKFIEDNDTVGIVPDNWLIGGSHTYWPPKSVSKQKIETLVRKKVEPDDASWDVTKVDIERSFGEYSNMERFLLLKD